VAEITTHLEQLVARHQATGVLIGLSGGIDSAVLATLAVKALGPESVHVSFLFDRDSERESARKAQLMADWLQIPLETLDISPNMRAEKVYQPFVMRLAPYSWLLNRTVQNAYSLLFNETPFKSTLRVGNEEFTASWFQRLIFNLTIHHVERGFTKRHVYRRVVLEQKAQERNLILIGAANRSEWEIGWFVKGGIDDLPIQPLTGLYKTQVRQLAKYLELPKPIQAQVPSPDMLKGITDELSIGHLYSRVDLVLDCLDRGNLRDEDAVEAGITRVELEDVRELRRLSAWKRSSHHEPPSVDG
jgi:NAD+ synthase